MLFLTLLVLGGGIANAQTGSGYYALAGTNDPTGGTVTGGKSGPISYSQSDQGYGAGSINYKGTVTASGPVTYTFQWSGGSLAPAEAIVEISVTATGAGASGSASDGLGDPTIQQGYTWTSSGTHYFVQKAGSTLTVTITGATASGTAGALNTNPPSSSTGSASVYVSVGVTPVQVYISGVDANAPYTQNQPGFLVGQQQIASLSAGNYTGDLFGFTWQVSGNQVFANQLLSADYSSNSYPAFQSPDSDSCSYSAGMSGTVSAYCSATFNAPDGSTWPVYASQPETAVVPNEGLVLTPGSTVDTFSLPGTGGERQELDTVGPGMIFDYYVEVPAPFAGDEGMGVFNVVQLVAFSHWGTYSGSGTVFTSISPGYPSFSLDNNYPYGNLAWLQGQTDTTTHQTNDNPSIGLTAPSGFVTKLYANFAAQMFLVFSPPVVNSSYTVPVQESDWTWNATDSGPYGPWPAPTNPNNPNQPTVQVGNSFSTGFSDFHWTAVAHNS